MNLRSRASRALIAGIAGITLLGGCALTQAGESDDTISIGLAVANQQADFFNQIREAVQARGAEDGVEVILSDAGGDANRQVSQIQDFITQKVDAIIYIPAGATAASVPIRDAHEAGIPVVTVDRNPEEEPGDTFIATDSVAAAKALGDWVVEQTGGEGRLGVIQGQIGTTPEIARNKGFEEALEGSDITEVARQASQGWHQDEGFNIAQDMLQANPDIDIIFGRADALALGAAEAARAAGYSPEDILIVGFDGDVAGLEAVRDGVIDATVTQQTQLMGGLAFDSAIKLIDGKDVPAEQLQEGIVTTPENVEPFIEQHP
ncbi:MULTISPECIES: substrate-binding domain-containing protein [unclassified Pseudactinotalea]|uniref:substrate-binding domain-containing protein n=1 Tax=unclassified Pseudactinotalea TaxID=2649176 RepID=UPI00128E6121|nr:MULTISPECIES: substrate-binding domain-containing protein [unclassified Pseudactinotalea]MPV51007.1 substrate-binding domain-containing protein [Pseudactinotalea sp. HY160]QGH69712.1 substrate-binding domain-containing protein [Pseudactinotalea sp. HY158]